MKSSRLSWSVIVLAGAMAGLSAGADAQSHTVEIRAGKDNTFHLADNARVLQLKAGEHVHFKVIAEFGGERGRDGSVHSFTVRTLRDQGWDVRLKEGVQEFDLTAPAPGEYLIECAVKCGPGHDAMHFKMIVQ